jgi:hypothetical protein
MLVPGQASERAAELVLGPQGDRIPARLRLQDVVQSSHVAYYP